MVNPYRSEYKNNLAGRTNFTGNVFNSISAPVSSVVEEAPSLLKKELIKVFDNFHSQAVVEVSDYGHFKPAKTLFNNPDRDLNVDKIILTIRKDPDKTHSDHLTRRYLDINVFGPNNATNITKIMSNGTKQELLATLKNNNFIQEVSEFIEKCSSSLGDELL